MANIKKWGQVLNYDILTPQSPDYGATFTLDMNDTQIPQFRAMLVIPKAQIQHRNEAIRHSYFSVQPTMAAIAQYFYVHDATLSRIIRKHEQS